MGPATETSATPITRSGRLRRAHSHVEDNNKNKIIIKNYTNKRKTNTPLISHLNYLKISVRASSEMALLNSNPMWSDEEKLKFIEEITENADAVQERVLAEILKQNAEAEYLQRHKLDGASDRATFKAKVPVITYEEIQPDIERIANGDRSPILSARPVTEFLTRYIEIIREITRHGSLS